ncbi:hypothetical protein ACT7DJ_31030 [Bacillus cereus]
MKLLEEGLTCEYEMDVDVFFKSIDLLFDNSIEKREIIRKFFSACESNSNLEVALIYCQVQGEYNLMQQLIEKHKKENEFTNFFEYI